MHTNHLSMWLMIWILSCDEEKRSLKQFAHFIRSSYECQAYSWERNNKDTDQFAQPRRLISSFGVRCHKQLLESKSKTPASVYIWADSWSQFSLDRFYHDAAHMTIGIIRVSDTFYALSSICINTIYAKWALLSFQSFQFRHSTKKICLRRFPTRLDSNRPALQSKLARSGKFGYSNYRHYTI